MKKLGGRNGNRLATLGRNQLKMKRIMFCIRRNHLLKNESALWLLLDRKWTVLPSWLNHLFNQISGSGHHCYFISVYSLTGPLKVAYSIALQLRTSKISMSDTHPIRISRRGHDGHRWALDPEDRYKRYGFIRTLLRAYDFGANSCLF